MKKRMTIAVIALVVVFGGIFAFVAFRNYMMGQFFANRSMPPVTVSARTAELANWQPRLTSVGKLSAVQGVDVSNQVPGVVEEILFKSGERVEKGQLLVQLDDSAEQARLPGLRAQVELAQANLARAKELVERNLTSEENIDTLQSQLEQARAELEALKATIAKKAVRAPFTGTLGIRMVDLGQYLPAGTPIVTLQALDQMHVDFTLPEEFLDDVAPGQRVHITVPTYPEQVFTGQVNAVAAKVDPTSHNFQVQGVIENPQRKLLPGMFADVNVLAGDPFKVITIPKTAVSYSLYGDAVYLVKEKGENGEGEPQLVAQQVFVKVGESRNGRVAVLDGVAPGDMVVTAGALKLHDGAPVVINNQIALTEVEPAARAVEQQITPVDENEE